VSKGCDLLVVNDVSAGQVFGRDDNAVVILDKDGTSTVVASASKAHIADAVLDVIVGQLQVNTAP
jgi:phosphopantothenoylcysteine decarboxylase/phosphopantothenate--cysteine ligase